MNAYHDFRLFYNQNIHPELLHLEHRRLRLLRLLAVSGGLMAAVVAMQIFVNVFVFTLLLLVPVAIWMSYLLFRVQVFYQEFKPRVVGLILDFIDNDVNFSFDGYDPKGSIDKKLFLESRIFTTADDYAGEDMIRGQVRETPFELCELRVKEFSPARNKLDYVFHGIFLIGDYKRWDLHGGVLVLPDTYRKYMSRSERAFHLVGGRRVKDNLLPEFEAFFDTYATPDIKIHEVISEDLQRVILKFREQFLHKNRQKEIYFSIIADKIYLALTQDKDLLEPSLFNNNTNFETVVEFYQDIRLLLEVVLDVDVMN